MAETTLYLLDHEVIFTNAPPKGSRQKREMGLRTSLAFSFIKPSNYLGTE